MKWHNIDPDLPMLSHAFDSNAAILNFARWQHGKVPHQPITCCRLQSVEYMPATRCTTTYLLGNKGTAWQTIGVVEVNPDGVEHRLFSDDPQLVGLSAAIDINMLTKGFARQHPELGSLDAVVPVRYKPGSRCTLRYHTGPERDHPIYFGKLLAQDSAALSQTVDNLYAASQRTPELPRVAQPLDYWPELGMLVQAAVSGDELHDLAFDPQYDFSTRVKWIRDAGRATAALHGCEINVPRSPRTLVSDLAALDAYRPALRQLSPHLASRFAEAIEFVGEAAQQQGELVSVLSHGALRTDQFMIEKGRLVLIDLDSLCWSSPARDLGNFLAYLTWKTLRQPHHAAFIQRGQQAFLDGYQTSRELPDARWLALYQVASILKVIGRRYVGLTHREWSLTEQLLDRAVEMVPA